MARQLPLPGMSRAKILGKDKEPRQLTFRGMGKMKKTKVAPTKEPKQEEVKVKKERAPRQDKLRSEMASGNRPMFMTPSEITRIANLGDAGHRNASSIAGGKSSGQKSREQNLLTKKLRESKTGTISSSHTKAEYQDGWTIHNGQEVRRSSLPSLHESIATEGFKGSFPLEETTMAIGPIGKPGKIERYLNVYEGHHRLAALRNLNKNQFVPIEYHK